MNKKSQAALSLLLPAIGAGLVFVGYNNYITISADDPYTQDNSTLLIILLITGLIFLTLGLIVIFNLFKGSQRANQ